MREYQAVQDQLRASALQIEQLQLQKSDLEMAKNEVAKSSGKVYLNVGGVMVETTREGALKDIGEKLELSGVRLQSLNKQYAEARAKEKELRDKLSKPSAGQ